MLWFHEASYDPDPLRALDDAESALHVACAIHRPQLIIAFVVAKWGGHLAEFAFELERRHPQALTLIVPDPALGIPFFDNAGPTVVLHAAHAPRSRFLPWYHEPTSNRLRVPAIPGPLGLLLFADCNSVQIDRLVHELGARTAGLAGVALAPAWGTVPFAIGGEVHKGGAMGVFCDNPSFAEADSFPLATLHSPTMIVTAGTGGLIETLDNRPAAAVLADWMRALHPADFAQARHGVVVELDLRAQGIQSQDSDFATCRMLGVNEEHGVLQIDAPTRLYQAARFAVKSGATAIPAIVVRAAAPEHGDPAPILLCQEESVPIIEHAFYQGNSRVQNLARWALRGVAPIAGSHGQSLPVHRHSVGVLHLSQRAFPGPQGSASTPGDA